MTTLPDDRSSNLTLALATHKALRRDLLSFERVAREPVPLSMERADRVLDCWNYFNLQLQAHHRGEDVSLWPRVRRRCDGDVVVLVTLKAREDDHARLDDLSLCVETETMNTPDVRSAFGVSFDRFAHELRVHLDDEEGGAFPFAAQLLSPGDWDEIAVEQRATVGIDGAATFFPWLLDACSEIDRSALLESLPPPVQTLIVSKWEPSYQGRHPWRVGS